MGPFFLVYFQGLAQSYLPDVQTFSPPRIPDHEIAYLRIINLGWYHWVRIMCWRGVSVNSEVLGKIGCIG